MSIIAIDECTANKFQVIWDLGRLCTYTCSYCPPHRRNNWSKPAKLKDMIQISKNLKRYNDIRNKYRKTPVNISCSFSGGEPTTNPEFFFFFLYMKETLPDIGRSITTNGYYNERRLRQIMDSIKFVTVSYHCEAPRSQKEIVKNNINTMHQSNFPFKVNVMFHQDPDYFKECIELCEYFNSLGIRYTPRLIGDQVDIKEGLKKKTVHTYTEEQMKWINKFWEASNKSLLDIKRKTPDKQDKKVIGMTTGRPCCGGRRLNILKENLQWKESDFVPQNDFRQWSCMISWYFLYIHQELNLIWQHQTCQINSHNKMGPLCKASEFGDYCNDLELELKLGKTNFTRCPKIYCGCGICVPKAKSDDLALSIFKKHIKNVEPNFTTYEPLCNNRHSVQNEIKKFDQKKRSY